MVVGIKVVLCDYWFSKTQCTGDYEGSTLLACCARGGAGHFRAVHMQPVEAVEDTAHVESSGVQVDARGQGAGVGRGVVLNKWCEKNTTCC